MQLISTFAHMGRNDAKVISRDSFLTTMLGYILFLSVLMRFGVPWLARFLAQNEALQFDLVPYYPLIVTFFAIFMGALATGMVTGFVLLDEREALTIRAVLVTPLSITNYVLYRILLPMILSFVLVIVQILIINITPISLWQLMLVGLASAFFAPIVSLFFATFPSNKVEAFALTKFTGLAGMAIAGAWFVPEPLQYLFGLFPPYWVVKGYWMAVAGNPMWWGALLLGIVLQLAMIVDLVKRFNHVAYKV